MHVAILGTYPPTRCGIATFTADVESALAGHGVGVTVLPVEPCGDGRPPEDADDAQPPRLCRDDPASYAAAARWVNTNGVDVVLVQHEFGIYGGTAGDHLLLFTEALKVPYVVTLHTVLSPYSVREAAVIQELCRDAGAVTVFTATARRLLMEQELAPARTMRIVPHGAPMELYADADRATQCERFGLTPDRRVVSTFGLLSEGKGIEVAIRAIGQLVDDHPDLSYVVAGQTHPEVVRRDGERYRQQLTALVSELGLEDHVVFVGRFMDIDEVAALLAITDVFCTPYRGENQIVSGALTFALAAGLPVVSTPYRYASDVLAGGAGRLVAFEDDTAMAEAIAELVADGPEREAALAAARAQGESMSWPAVGDTMRSVLADAAMAAHRPAALRDAPAIDLDVPVRTTHLKVLCDDTGMIQHAYGRLPRLEEGYCVDDAGRLLPLAAHFAEAEQDPGWSVILARLLGFVRAAALGGHGDMRNFMSFDRRWLDEPYAGDHVARAVWGLGELVGMDGPLHDEALELLNLLAPGVVAAPWSRTHAYGALGLVAANAWSDPELSTPLERVYDHLSAWEPGADPAWRWCEPRLTYDNARIPEALIRVGGHVGDAALVERGVELLAWLDRVCRLEGDHYRFPGHRGAARVGDIAWSGDEQPLEASALADAHAAVLTVTGDRAALAGVDRAYAWFLGANRLGRRMGDPATGSCCDGLGAGDVNHNCGAESTIAFHRCRLTWQSSHQLIPAGRSAGPAREVDARVHP